MLRHADGWCAITGGSVVRDRRLRALAGRYVFADLCSGRIWTAALAGTTLRDARPLGLTAPNPVSFGEDARGRVYVVSFTGELFRLQAR